MLAIKFRVWDGSTMYPVTRLDFMAKGIWIEPSNDVCGFLGDRFKALMQFTGLHDKNGKEIWEGDILKENNYYRPYIVEWDKYGCGFRLKYLNSEAHKGMIPYGCEVEVLGNIYENPELLK